MKIAVSTSNGGLKDAVCQFFGRCPTFTIVEADGKKINGASVFENPGNRAGGGAGIASAQAVIDAGAEAVITGSCGPKAMIVLSQSGIRVFSSVETVEAAVKKLLAGKLAAVSTVPGHFGMGPGRGIAPGRGAGFRGGMR